jgi:hypothetical protein
MSRPATKVWNNTTPWSARFSCWLARCHCLPANERRFRHQLSFSALCPSCTQDEDTDHMLLRPLKTCIVMNPDVPAALLIWKLFRASLTPLQSRYKEKGQKICICSSHRIKGPRHMRVSTTKIAERFKNRRPSSLNNRLWAPAGTTWWSRIHSNPSDRLQRWLTKLI